MPVGSLRDMSYDAQKRRHPKWVRLNMWRSTHKVPGTNVALLSVPDAMPGPSWSLPAGPACPFMVTGAGTICGTCYAAPEHHGRYGMTGVVGRAQQARWDWTRRCMRTPEGRREFVDTLVAGFMSVRVDGILWVRVHDSGDLFSAPYTRCWIEICQRVPHARFWFPTRSWQAPWVSVIRELAALPNVTVRPSALNIDGAPPVIEGLAAGTTVVFKGATCPKLSQNNNCVDCRACWLDDTQEGSYLLH